MHANKNISSTAHLKLFRVQIIEVNLISESTLSCGRLTRPRCRLVRLRAERRPAHNKTQLNFPFDQGSVAQLRWCNRGLPRPRT